MAIVGRTAFSALLAPDIWEVYEMTGKERPLEYDKVVNTRELPWNPAKDQQVAGLGTVPSKPEGTPFVLDQPVIENNLSVLATPYGLAVEFTYEAWEDELYGVFKDMAAELARSARNRYEVIGWNPFNQAFNTAVIGFNPGESLCSTTHTSSATGIVQANRPSPDVGFSISGVQASIVRFHRMLNDRGLPQLMHPTKGIVDPFNLWAAREILGSSGKPYTADNEINSLIPEELSFMVSHYLSTQTYWFLSAEQGEHDVNYGWRTHPLFDSFDDPWTKNAIFSVYFRAVSWFGDWRGIDGSTG
jgi:hypothetical protein